MSNPETRPSIAFIGGGNMARSLIGGLIARQHPAAGIRVAEPVPALREALQADFGVQVFDEATLAADGAPIWVLAVKPQVMRAVCTGLQPLAQAQKPMAVSIAAGISSGQLQRWLGGELAVVRTMPNTPALLGAGATGLFANARVAAEQRLQAQTLMAATGITAWIDEEAQMDTVTALSGSGPAYVFLLAEAMQAAGEAHGLPPDTARTLALQTIFGAARMLLESGESAATLRQRVTSPGGTTQAALEVFAEHRFMDVVGDAIGSAARRGRELSAANE